MEKVPGRVTGGLLSSDSFVSCARLKIGQVLPLLGLAGLAAGILRRIGMTTEEFVAHLR